MFGPTDSQSYPPGVVPAGGYVPPGPPPVGSFSIAVYPLSEGYVVQTPYHALACGNRQQLHRAINRVLSFYEELVGSYAQVPTPTVPAAAQSVPETSGYITHVNPTAEGGGETPPDLLEMLNPQDRYQAQRDNIVRIINGRLRGTVATGEVAELVRRYAPDVPADEASEIMAREEVRFFEGEQPSAQGSYAMPPEMLQTERPISVEEWAANEHVAVSGTPGDNGTATPDA